MVKYLDLFSLAIAACRVHINLDIFNPSLTESMKVNNEMNKNNTEPNHWWSYNSERLYNFTIHDVIILYCVSGLSIFIL